MGYQYDFAASHYYKGEILGDAMVQTIGQQTKDQCPPGRGALQGVTAEGDAVATTVSSGNTLKHASQHLVLNTALPSQWTVDLDGKV